MRYLDELEKEPYRFDFFDVMRRLERSLKHRPRIGDSASIAEESIDDGGKTFVVELGQQPFLAFPDSNIAAVEVETENRQRIRILSKFLGMLGPQGALPLATTDEAMKYLWEGNDDAFPRFLDLFNQRFLQLFFRAWGDSRPIVHADRPDADHFRDYVGTFVGLGSAPYKNLDSVSDDLKRAYAGLIGAQTKSASRLKGFLDGLFGIRAEIEEFVGVWLECDDGMVPGLGGAASTLGVDLLVGKRVFDIQSKIRIRIYEKDLAEYRRFLPTGDLCEPLADAVYFYIGDELDWDVELALPAGCAEPVKLGQSGQIGWTSWASPNWSGSQEYLCDARFHPAERMRQRRRKQLQA